MAKKLGFIGAGNMAAAIIGGAVGAGAVAAGDILAADADAARLAFVAEKFGVRAAGNLAVARAADILFLSVKPQVYDAVISEIRGAVKDGAVVVILAAGLSIADVREKFGATPPKLAKVMPNTPALVNSAMTAVCADVSAAELDGVLKIFNSVGRTEILPERFFDAFTGIAGSSPAYVFTFIEAMADAGVKHGLSRDFAIQAGAQAVLGAAKMVLETGEHPAVLRDAVCSPGGTTIAAVGELERAGFRNAIISAVSACVEKYNDLKG